MAESIVFGGPGPMTLSLDCEIIYPDSDGQPMADNTKQFRWIVLLKENLDCLFADNPEVFVAGDLLWYPVDGHPEIRMAPDVMVVLGRPKGDRGSYRQWQEANIAPQVVFEILSPGNTLKEMARKQKFYEKYGVEEYYIYDPDRDDLTGFQREGNELMVIEDMTYWVSPRLGIRFDWESQGLRVGYPDGSPFLTTLELAQQAQILAQQVEQERQRAEQADQQLALERQRAESLAEKLRSLGIDPDH